MHILTHMCTGHGKLERKLFGNGKGASRRRRKRGQWIMKMVICVRYFSKNYNYKIHLAQWICIHIIFQKNIHIVCKRSGMNTRPTIHKEQGMEGTPVSVNWSIGKKNMAHINKGMLFSHKQNKTCHLQDVDGAGDHCFKWNKAGAERQAPWDSVH